MTKKADHRSCTPKRPVGRIVRTAIRITKDTATGPSVPTRPAINSAP